MREHFRYHGLRPTTLVAQIGRCQLVPLGSKHHVRNWAVLIFPVANPLPNRPIRYAARTERRAQHRTPSGYALELISNIGHMKDFPSPRYEPETCHSVPRAA